MSEKKASTFIEKIKKIKHIEIIIAVLAVAVMLVIYFSTRITTSNGKTQTPTATDYCQSMQQQLTDTLGAMKGAGKVKVLINWECSVENVPGQNSSSGAIKQVYPKAVGVIIICQGGENVKVKIDIIRAVSVFLDISEDKIMVYPMKEK